MPGARTVAKSYARALYELARERGQVEAVARDLAAVAAVLREAEELREVLGRPWVAPAAKRAVVVELAARLGLAPLTREFLGLVARQRRAAQLEAIAAAFRTLADRAAGRVRARVRTAVPLTPEEREALARRLGQALGGREVVLEETVDPRLLGGFVAEVDSLMVDASLDGQVARLRARLAGTDDGRPGTPGDAGERT